jgi:hypothetical protein
MLANQVGVAEGEWQRSRSCVGEGHCVEVSVVNNGAQVRMRNSTTPETVLVLNADGWRSFLDAVKADELQLTR